MAPARWLRAATAELFALTDLVELLEAAADGDAAAPTGAARAVAKAAHKRTLVEFDRHGEFVTPDEFDEYDAAVADLAVRGAAADRRLLERAEADRPSPDELAARRARTAEQATDRRAERIAARRSARDARTATAPPAPVHDLGTSRARQAERNRLAGAVAALHLAVDDAARVDALHALRRVALDVGDMDYAAWARKELRHAGHGTTHAESDAGPARERALA